MGDGERRRVIEWQDPMITANAGKTMSGLDFLQAIFRGDIPQPPIGITLNFRGVEVEAGRVVFAGEPDESCYNPIGVVHGGYISTLLDSAMACAGQTMIPKGFGYTTLELHINFVRAVTRETGTIRAIGETLHVGKRVITAQGRLVDAHDKLYAHATTTCLVIPLEGT